MDLTNPDQEKDEKAANGSDTNEEVAAGAQSDPIEQNEQLDVKVNSESVVAEAEENEQVIEATTEVPESTEDQKILESTSEVPESKEEQIVEAKRETPEAEKKQPELNMENNITLEGDSVRKPLDDATEKTASVEFEKAEVESKASISKDTDHEAVKEVVEGEEVNVETPNDEESTEAKGITIEPEENEDPVQELTEAVDGNNQQGADVSNNVQEPTAADITTSEESMKSEITENSLSPVRMATKSPIEQEHAVIIPTAGNPDNEGDDGVPKPAVGVESRDAVSEKNEPVVPVHSKADEDQQVDGADPATVKFELQPSKYVVTTAVPIGQPIIKFCEILVTKVGVPINFLTFLHEGTTLKKDVTLRELKVKPNTTVTLQVSSLDPEKHPIKVPTSDAINVLVLRDGGHYENVTVTIKKPKKKKPFLGGFKHKVTGIQYHNASAQTDPKPPRWPKTTLFDRDCQTVIERKQATQTTNTTSTQMTVPYCHMSVFEDKVIKAKKYFTSRQFLKRRLEAVFVIQRYWRRWLACRYCDRIRKARDERLEWERQEEIRKRKEKEDRIRREFERRMKPKTKEDFDLVYAALEKWRLEEIANINDEMLDEPTRKAALCALLEQETQLIASIGKHKVEADKTNRVESIQALLDKAAAPKRWKAFDGKWTEMDTKYTIRAKEMRDIYNSITMKYLTQDERLDVLLTLKHTVKEHDCKLTREIIELIDREADLIMRGVSDTNLEGLRQRIATLFLEYCKNPMFNPEIARYLRVPQDPSTIKQNVYFCEATHQYLPSTEFKLRSDVKSHGRCRKAMDTDNIARTRQNYSKYRIMLRNLRRREAEYPNPGKSTFILQEKDLQYLVDNIWMSQSILSAWEDMADLELIRWKILEEWSPWNCILLTKDEAIAHLKIEDLTEAYGDVFVNKVRHKHTLARIYFSKLPGMSEQLRLKTGSKKMPGLQELCGKNLLFSR